MPAIRLCACLMLCTAAIELSGCAPAANPSPSAPTARGVAEAAWIEQVAEVRAGRSRRIIVARSRVTSTEFATLADGCLDLEVLDLDAVDISAIDLAVIPQLPHLQRIKLGAPVDDAGLERLIQATELTAVNLPAGTFTNRGLERLAQLPRLELLRFHSPNVTDDGLRHIADMPALRFLHLIDVPVTDTGLSHLHGMQRLESFYLDGGQCTAAGLRGLLKALPDLHFHLDQLHLPGDPQTDAH